MFQWDLPMGLGHHLSWVKITFQRICVLFLAPWLILVNVGDQGELICRWRPKTF
jgi:hypothetical protein